VALHRSFHDRLAALVAAATDRLPPGRDHLLAGTLAYLDGCRQDQGTRALLVEARAEPALPAEVARRNEQFTDLAAPDFAAMGWSRQPGIPCRRATPRTRDSHGSLILGHVYRQGIRTR
jgi:hypothetical protein